MEKRQLITLISALILTPTYFVLSKNSGLDKWHALLHFVGLIAGCIGFVLLLIWNVLLRKNSLIEVNMFFTLWMFGYFLLMVFAGP